jgi:hypothetical protein
MQRRMNGLQRFDLLPEGGKNLGVVGTRDHFRDSLVVSDGLP